MILHMLSFPFRLLSVHLLKPAMKDEFLELFYEVARSLKEEAALEPVISVGKAILAHYVHAPSLFRGL